MIVWSNYKKGINLASWLVLQNEHGMFLCWGTSVFLPKKLPQHQNTVMFKYGIFDFVCVHQVITSLARTGTLFQKKPYIFKLLIIMTYIYYMFQVSCMHNRFFALFTKIEKRKGCVALILSAYFSIKMFLTKYPTNWPSFNIIANFKQNEDIKQNEFCNPYLASWWSHKL